MDTRKIFKNYLIFIALPTIVTIALMESALAPGTFLNTHLRRMVVAGSGELFLLERGGQRSQARGMDYYSRMTMPIYEKGEGANMAFKDFMVWHVTEYEPAMLLNLADDWPAL